MKKTFNMTDEDFKRTEKMGLEKVKYDKPIKLTKEQVQKFISILAEIKIQPPGTRRAS